MLSLTVFGVFLPFVFYFANLFVWVTDLRRYYYTPEGSPLEVFILATLFGIPAIGTSLVTERLYMLYFRGLENVFRSLLILGLFSATCGTVLFTLNSASEWGLTLPSSQGIIIIENLKLYWISGFLAFSLIYGAVVGGGCVVFLASRYPPAENPIEVEDAR